MRDLMQALLFGLIPPQLPMSDNGPPSKEETLAYRKAKIRWYRAVASALWVVLLTLIFFISWALGLLPRTTGLAYAEDLQKAANEVTEKIANVEQSIAIIALDQLESRLMLNRRLQCEAIAANDPARKQTYATIMQELKVRYYKMEQVQWDQPDCASL